MSELIKSIVYKHELSKYYKELKCILTRYDIEYIMNNCEEERCIHDNVHYIFLTYLNSGIVLKIINEYYSIDCISEYTSDEVVSLLDGPLKERNWSHIRQIYMAGFRDDVLISYGSEIKPCMLGYSNENEIYQYMLTLHPTIPFCDTYERYYEIWYRINPSSVKDHKLSCRMKNIKMLKRLGFKEAHKYIKKPEGDCSEYDRQWAKYYIASYILDGKCPYDAIDWEDSIYDVSLDSDVRASYFRYFRKHDITTDKRYNIFIVQAEKYNNISILDIIDNVSYTSILECYIETGKYKEYLSDYLDPEYIYNVSYQPTYDMIRRLVEVGYVKHISLCFKSCLTEDMAKIFQMNGIKVNICNHDFLSLCIAIEYDIIDLDLNREEMDISHTYTNININNDDNTLYKLIMYSKGLITIWNKFPSLILLNIILKYAPNIIHKIIIPDHISKFSVELCIDKNVCDIRNKYMRSLCISYKVDVEFKFMEQ